MAALPRVSLSLTLSSAECIGAANRVSLLACHLSKLKGQQSSSSYLKQTRPSLIKGTITSSKVSAMTESAIEADYDRTLLGQENQDREAEKGSVFDWNEQWYPVAVLDNLDKRVPTAATIMGRDLVVWWDRHAQLWQVWDDKCPHRLAPLSEGRINEKGELQCSYHGWCFAGCSASCTFIPQAPLDGARVWESDRACASVYPSVEQEGLLWFWPDTRPEFRNIAETKPPPSIPALADPTFKDELHSRNLPYGYEQLIENLMDPAHVPFAHHGLQGFRSDAKPLNYRVNKVEKSGYIGDAERGPATFIAPCIFTLDSQFNAPKNNSKTTGKPQKRLVLVFICIPVSPGQSKVIWAFCRNFSVWVDPLIPRWFIHIRQMLVLDSDLYLLHVAERKVAEAGNIPWDKACYLPTTSDAFVVAFRKWLHRYAGGGPEWGGPKYTQLPPTPPKEQLMDRYWSHVKICRHCTAAKAFFERAEVVLQALAVAIAAVLGAAAIKPIPQLRSWSIPLVVVAIISSVSSRWLGHFVYKTYRFHDYNHALVK